MIERILTNYKINKSNNNFHKYADNNNYKNSEDEEQEQYKYLNERTQTNESGKNFFKSNNNFYKSDEFSNSEYDLKYSMSNNNDNNLVNSVNSIEEIPEVVTKNNKTEEKETTNSIDDHQENLIDKNKNKELYDKDYKFSDLTNHFKDIKQKEKDSIDEYDDMNFVEDISVGNLSSDENEKF